MVVTVPHDVDGFAAADEVADGDLRGRQPMLRSQRVTKKKATKAAR